VGRKNVSLGIIITWFLSYSLFAQDELKEYCSEEQIKTVLFYNIGPNEPFQNKYTNSAVTILNQKSQRLILEFDDLRATHRLFKVKIIHVDLGWQKSKLREMQYLQDFNEYFINDYKVSEGPKVNYYHYGFLVPKPKISGNYVLQVFDSNDEDKVIIQKRFWVLEPKIGVLLNVNAAQAAVNWRTKHQVDLNLEMGNYFINFPEKELVIKLRQNQRTDTEKVIQNTSLVKTGRSTFSFKNFEDSLLFDAGNEFRFVDITDAYRRGQNVQEASVGVPNKAWSVPQRTRSKFNYTQTYDADGNFIVNSLDGNSPDLAADYTELSILTETKSMIKPPAVLAKFTDWQPISMEMNPNFGLWESKFLLKQGIYDFLIVGGGEDMEGDFSDTNNTYEVFVYQKTPGKPWTELIAYQILQMGR
jgi:hypothetical protein